MNTMYTIDHMKTKHFSADINNSMKCRYHCWLYLFVTAFDMKLSGIDLFTLYLFMIK